VTEDKPAAEAAPPATIRIQCKGPGPAHYFEIVPRGGRRPAYCPEHRRAPSVERSELAYRARRGMAHELEATRARARESGRALRLAAGLRVLPDPIQAAGLVGLDVQGPELEELVRRAHTEHARVISGDLRDLASLAEATLTMILLEVVERRAELPAKDLAAVAGLALKTRQDVRGDGPETNYVSINLSVTPPPADGKLTPDQLAQIRGTKPSEEEEEEEPPALEDDEG